tara:strand:+ start:63 stop:563 length:501 start_codon:yes stop_codon:yes gene_type:complete
MAGPLRQKDGELKGPMTVKKENEKIKNDKRSYVPASEADTPEGDAGMKNTKEKAAALNKEGRKGFKPKKEPVTAMDKYGDQLKALLSNKDKLVGTKVKGDNRNKYQIQINELKKRMKADGLKFNSLLKDVKKQEREGQFDRGAEGKTKNKLRQKMQSEKIGGSRGR